MRRRSRILGTLARTICCVGILGLPAAAFADTQRAQRAVAQALFDEGRKLMAERNFELACAKFEESVRIVQLSGTLLNLGDCYEKQGRLATAWSTFITAATNAHHAGNAPREHEARDRAAALIDKLPKLLIRVGDANAGGSAGLELKRDDAVVGSGQWDVPIPVDPGPHHITATAPNRRPWEVSVNVEPGAVVTVNVPTLEPLPSPPVQRVEPPALPAETPQQKRSEIPAAATLTPEPKSSSSSHQQFTTAALITGGVGALGLAAGGIFGLLSLQKHNAADGSCDYDACNPEGVELRDQARTMGDLSTAGFVIGAVGIAASVTLWLTAPEPQRMALRLPPRGRPGTAPALVGWSW